MSVGHASSLTPYQIQIEPIQARSTLIEIAETFREMEKLSSDFNHHPITEQRRKQMARLILSYRMKQFGEAPEDKISIASAPFPGMVLLDLIPKIWNTEYQKNYQTAYQENVADISVLVLFDEFMKMIAEGRAPESLKKEARKIGPCIAHKVLRAKDDQKCNLNVDPDYLPKIPIRRLLRVKMGCKYHRISPCETRQAIFYAAKKSILNAKKDPHVQSMIKTKFEKIFPKEFKKGFLGQLTQKMTHVASIVNQKFKGTFSKQLWHPQVSLIENFKDPKLMTLRNFIEGLRADLNGAVVLSQSSDPQIRGLAAPLFYASANRLLVLMGGKRAVVRKGALLLESSTGVPRVYSENFGGWGVLETPSRPQFLSWDWGKYDPAAQPPTPARLFPAVFYVNSQTLTPKLETTLSNGPLAQNMEDLADLITVLIDFLKSTKPNGPLGPYFLKGGAEEEMVKLLEPGTPEIFPEEGRRLILGTLAGALKNLTLRNQGHIEQGNNSEGMLRFFSWTHLGGRFSGQKVRVSAVSQVLIGASQLLDLIENHSEGMPQGFHELTEIKDGLKLALNFGGLKLAAEGKDSQTGGFYRELNLKEGPFYFEDSLDGLWGLTASYTQDQKPIFLVRIKSTLGFMKKLWGSSETPWLTAESFETRISPRVAWKLYRYWKTYGEVLKKSQLSGVEIDWTYWEEKFAQLGNYLKTQLSTELGPHF